MSFPHVRHPLVTTIQEQCQVCYTCVRECPAKAIRISSGQAEVLPERCIGCGNCVRVCSQHAKKVLSSIDAVGELLRAQRRVAACLAPSFPAEFADIDYRSMVGMLRALGFDHVHEVAFGADLVAARYARLLKTDPERRYIAANCPAIVEFVERYHPGLVEFLAPVASPMLATARVLRTLYGRALAVVFIGPCIAKKAERDPLTADVEIEAVLTFRELREMFDQKGLAPADCTPGDFDPPVGNLGALFPISRGMLQAADIGEDLRAGEVVAAEGRNNFTEAIKEFESGDLDARLLEVLCCSGCIMGPGISNPQPLFSRRSHVSRYVRQRAGRFDAARWQAWMDEFVGVDLSRGFQANDQRIRSVSPEALQQALRRMGKVAVKDELNCGACGYDSCREHARAICLGLAEVEMCLPYTIEHLRQTMKDLAISDEQLASVQAALIQSEKLASMGQLAAAIAHEVNNPLGVVLMYAHLLLDEWKASPKLADDLGMIAEQADRCRKIVAGLLKFARQNKMVRQPTVLAELLAHSLKAVPPPAGIDVRVHADLPETSAELDADQMTQVIVNLVNNAYEAMPDGGTLTLTVAGDAERVRLDFADSGVGIPEEHRLKIFEPFFTTKQMDKGTGLGLAVSYGIVKMHRGDIRVVSNTDSAAGPTGTTFTVILPRWEQAEGFRPGAPTPEADGAQQFRVHPSAGAGGSPSTRWRV